MKTQTNAQYFFLFAHCVLVKGVQNGAVYDLKNGDVYTINKDETAILDLCEKAKQINFITQKLKLPQTMVNHSLDELNKIGVGSYYRNPVYIDKQIDRQTGRELVLPVQLHTLIVELNRKCNLDCVYCSYNGRQSYRYCGCQRGSGDVALNMENVIEVISRLRIFNLHAVYFVGGDPFLDAGTIRSVAKVCCEWDVKVIVYTNGTNIGRDTRIWPRELNVKLEIPVYSSVSDLHDYIVGVDGGHHALLHSIEALGHDEIAFDLCYCALPFNVNGFEETLELFENFGGSIAETKIIFPLHHDERSQPLLEFYNKWKMSFPKIDRRIFNHYRENNPCLSGKIAITADGFFRPCHMFRNVALGNIRDHQIDDILRSGKLDYYWRLSKRKFETCKACELRYLCEDCPVVEHDIEARGLGPNLYCDYDPSAGDM